jgi:TRAP-type C4-dicarboxylate transport system permease small subunit
VNDDQTRSVGSLPSAAPSTTARLLALLAILVAGTCGGLVGHAVTSLQCVDDCTALAGSMGVLGAVLAAGGVGIVAVLSLRAMSEWRTGQLQQAARDDHPVD